MFPGSIVSGAGGSGDRAGLVFAFAPAANPLVGIYLFRLRPRPDTHPDAWYFVRLSERKFERSLSATEFEASVSLVPSPAAARRSEAT